MIKSQKTIIGRVAKADFPADSIFDVPVKIDTGADSSAIWATNIYIGDDQRLRYTLFSPQSKHYTGKENVRKNYVPKVIRTASGHAQVRYSVKLSISLEGRRVVGTFTLADRSKNTYPVLVGCKLLNNKFIVDVSKGEYLKKSNMHTDLQQEFESDPRAFFEKYHRNNERGDLDR